MQIRAAVAARSVASGRSPQKVYADHSPGNFSLGAPALGALTSEGAFPHMSPQSLKLRGAAWRAWRILEGDLQVMRKTWLSLLFLPGFLARGRWTMVSAHATGRSVFITTTDVLGKVRRNMISRQWACFWQAPDPRSVKLCWGPFGLASGYRSSQDKPTVGWSSAPPGGASSCGTSL